ncbi:uncharacterized protein [Clytia hemisphaerica]|uniref:uncharacterized protein n=1 Tax=Clytia hemisphaerica TaxID=252671 RepID=UPI0034D56CEC
MEQVTSNEEREEREEDVLNPKKELKCAFVKTTLKSFVIQHVSKCYQAAAIRVMLPTGSKTEVWLARQKLENRFSNELQIVGFFSCATALYGVKKGDEQQTIAGVSFWVMFDWPDMAIESYECHLTKIVIESGLDIVHCKAVKGRGVRSITESYVSSLYIALKDHNNEALLHHFAKSQVKCLKAAAEEEGIDLVNVDMTEGERYSSKVLTSLWLCKTMGANVASELKKAVDLIKMLMSIKVVDLTSKEDPVHAAPMPVSRLLQSITAIKHYMTQNEYGLFDGSVYKKAPQAKFTYVFCSSVHDFVHYLLGCPEIADQIVAQVTPIINLLSVSSCRIIKPLIVDYNFIEVAPYGTCFNISEKCFQVDPPTLKGSPRAFVKYTYDPDVLPYPEPFVKGVENSFGNPRIRKKFYKKYYQLLMHGQFPHKETKMCLVGPADSGKTSWFSCFQGIIPSKYIAGVMNDGRFSAALINSNTQIVMMDEWTPDSLSCEDAKRVLQGGMNFLPQKHKSGLRVNYNSGFFITTNVYPDFGNERDCDAIRKRLEVFQTTSLKRKDPSVSAWLRMNCMMVFHFLAHELRNEPIFDTPNVAPAAGNGAIYNDFDFDPMSLMYDDQVELFSFSQPAAPAAVQDSGNEVSGLTQALDHAVLEADRHEGIHYEDLQWETPLFDNASEHCDDVYVQKVVTLASNKDGAWDELALTDNAKNMFRRRLRAKWEGADSVYDAWLIRKGCQRPWFDYHLLDTQYPEFDADLEQEPPTQVVTGVPETPTKQSTSCQPPESPKPDDANSQKSIDSVITSYQPPKSPKSDDENSEESIDSVITSYQPPKSPNSDDGNNKAIAESVITSDQPPNHLTLTMAIAESVITSDQPPKSPNSDDGNNKAIAESVITSDQPPKSPNSDDGNTESFIEPDDKDTNNGSQSNARPVAPNPVNPASESDISIEEDAVDPPTGEDDQPKAKRFSLSLKRCTHTETDLSHQLITLTSSDEETNPNKRQKTVDSEGSSIEFDMQTVAAGVPIIPISSNDSSTDSD